MKWLFRIFGFILILFIGLCAVGAFLPSTQRVDKTIEIAAEIEDVYEVVSDLQSYPEWSGFGGDLSNWVFGDIETGLGQTAAWQFSETKADQFGSLEVLQVERNEYVRIRASDHSGEHIMTIAMTEEDDGTSCLIQAERQFGGFPYFGRIAGFRQKAKIETSLEQAASGLVDLFQ